jgi:hypothetical protein
MSSTKPDTRRQRRSADSLPNAFASVRKLIDTRQGSMRVMKPYWSALCNLSGYSIELAMQKRLELVGSAANTTLRSIHTASYILCCSIIWTLERKHTKQVLMLYLARPYLQSRSLSLMTFGKSVEEGLIRIGHYYHTVTRSKIL